MANWVPKYRNVGQPRGARGYLNYIGDTGRETYGTAEQDKSSPAGDQAERGLAAAIGKIICRMVTMAIRKWDVHELPKRSHFASGPSTPARFGA